MSIPDFQTVMLPVLRFAADGNEHTPRAAMEYLANEFGLTDADRRQLLPSGQQSTFDNRVHWAIFHLKHAMLLQGSRRGYFRITQRGQQTLVSGIQRVDLRYLAQFPEWVEFRAEGRKHAQNGAIPVEQVEDTVQHTPAELLEDSYQRLRRELVDELLDQVKNSSPTFFERLVVALLVKMGYGGSLKDAGEAIGRSGDGGIDGIIKEDPLGLDIIHVQAKRWDKTVGRPDIQQFAGALQGRRARKGVFLTTSDFSREARDYVANIESKIVLIDGEQLATLMIEHDVGVSPVASYVLKKVDSDYFSEE